MTDYERIAELMEEVRLLERAITARREKVAEIMARKTIRAGWPAQVTPGPLPAPIWEGE